MDTHIALQKLTMTKVIIVSHCSLVNAAIVANSRPVWKTQEICWKPIISALKTCFQPTERITTANFLFISSHPAEYEKHFEKEGAGRYMWSVSSITRSLRPDWTRDHKPSPVWDLRYARVGVVEVKSRDRAHVHTLIGTTAHFNLGWSKILVFQSCCDFANVFMFVVPHPQRICSSFVAILVPFVHLFSPAWLTLWKPFCKICCTLNDSDEYFVHIGFRGCIGPEKEVRFDAAAKRWWPSNLFLISSV